MLISSIFFIFPRKIVSIKSSDKNSGVLFFIVFVLFLSFSHWTDSTLAVSCCLCFIPVFPVHNHSHAPLFPVRFSK